MTNNKELEEVNSVITNVINVSPMMRIIRVKPEGWELPKHESGQFVAIGLPTEIDRYELSTEEYSKPNPGILIKRAYSIASSSSQDYVEFYITVVHSGSLTPRLFSLNIGDKIWMSKEISGMFTLDQVEESKNIILIATGSGIAPYMSMLRSNALNRSGKIMIIHGSTNSWDLGYQSELELLDVMMPNFTYYPTITNPDLESKQWSGDDRSIEDIWKGDTIKTKIGVDISPENSHIFLCGNPIMIDNMMEEAAKKGFTEYSEENLEGQLHYEKF